MELYWQLFLSFLQIGAFSFGGGYAAMPLIQDQVVEIHGWLTMSEFTDLVTISQMTPGPIAVNAATFVGTRLAGTGGAVVATLGCILPSCLLVTLIAWLYLKYRTLSALQSVLAMLRPAVVAMIAAAGVSILVSAFWGGEAVSAAGFRGNEAVIFAVCLFLLMRKKWNPVAVMVLAGGMNVALAAAGML
ncbi:MAG: chromate transporter [Eubacteriales bacterium]|nr:chromate transporter [Eubacteriales bacterium]